VSVRRHVPPGASSGPEGQADLFHVADLDPRLPGERDRVLAELRGALPEAEVFEVGSTAVPGVIGKGDLDFLVRVPPAGFAHTRASLDAWMPRNTNQLSTDIYQGYLVPSPLDVAVQLTVTGGPHDNFLVFVDALRSDVALVTEYNALKRRWHGQPMDSYREAKSAFIQRVLAGR
jgi:GrpB-like predicted nucleotidyltransferase (UPF0157 family)